MVTMNKRTFFWLKKIECPPLLLFGGTQENSFTNTDPYYWSYYPVPDIYLTLPAPEESGWTIQGSQCLINWELPEIEKKIRFNIDFLLEGCNCKKQCKTLSCRCKRKLRKCGQGCLCQGCTNVRHLK